ncbi:MAG TPA: division/cell wall cluster transcriptional repressor MraZ [Oscillospiraceae bacterium]|nr:division/cell wall cluster transcriptional repressor MraZ [Oscillospiraceae bacterium]
MLIGEYGHSIDLKGRMNFPAKMREDLGLRFIVVKGFGNPCLYVYSIEEWSKIESRIDTMPLAKAQQLQRFLSSSASEVEPDKQGRILIPLNLRNYAGLEQSVTVIGASNRAEIWNTEKWDELNKEITLEMFE